MHIDNLVLELTRKCNLSCNHCLRGKAENCDMDKTVIDAALDKFTSIGSLGLGGGESSLVPELIVYLIKQLKKKKIRVCSFDITTNAVKPSAAFIKAIIDLYFYCDDKDGCGLSISNDAYHADSYGKSLEANYEKLEVFRFASRRQENNNVYYHNSVIDQGKGTLYGSGRQLRYSEVSYSDMGDEEYEINSLLYVNCYGNVVACCDLSYKSQDCEALHIFNVKDNVDIIEVIQKYNKKVNYISEECGSSVVEDMVDYFESYINVETEKAA